MARRRPGKLDEIRSDRFSHVVLGRDYNKVVAIGGVNLAPCDTPIDLQTMESSALNILQETRDPGAQTAAALDVMACRAASVLKSPNCTEEQRDVANQWIVGRREFELADFLLNGVHRSRHQKHSCVVTSSGPAGAGSAIHDFVEDGTPLPGLNWRRTGQVLTWSRAGASAWTDAFLAACGNVAMVPHAPSRNQDRPENSELAVLQNTCDEEGFWDSQVLVPATLSARGSCRHTELPRMEPQLRCALQSHLKQAVKQNASAKLKVSASGAMLSMNPFTIIQHFLNQLIALSGLK
jgi:hypothetical protein